MLTLVPLLTRRILLSVPVLLIVAALLLGLTDMRPASASLPLHPLASQESNSKSAVYLPTASRGHPVGVCRGVVTGEKAVELANWRAAMEDLGPPRGYQERFVRRAEMLSGAQHDALYPDEPIVHRGLPTIEPWDCFWRVELDVYGMWNPGHPGAEPWPVRWFKALVDAQAGEIRSWTVSSAPPDAPTSARQPTPLIHPTGTPTPRP